jgi:WD40 repeat protein
MTLEGHSNGVTAVQFSSDGSKLGSASHDHTVIVWDPNTGALLQKLDAQQFVSDVAFSANGSFLQTNIGSFALQTVLSGLSGRDAWSSHLQVQGTLWHDHKTIWSRPGYLLLRRADAALEPTVASDRSSGAIHAVDDDG